MKNKKLIGIIVFSIVIVIAVVVSIIIAKNIGFLDKNVDGSIASNSLYLVDTDENKKIYVNTNGQIVKFDEYSSMSNFSYGSSLVEKEDKKFIINSAGKIIVSPDKYDSINTVDTVNRSSKGLNYIAEKEGKYAILDSFGKELTEFKYSWISSVRECDKIYEIEDYGKTGYISVTGKELVEPLYDEEDLNCFADTNSKMLVIKVKNNYYVYDLTDYSLKYEIELSNAYISIEDKYIYDIDTKTIYLFDRDINYKTKLKVDVKDEIKVGWTNEYASIFKSYIDNGYLIYTNKEGKEVVVANDGKTLDTGYFNYLIGKDYIFLYNYDSSNNDDSLKIYNGSVLKKVLKDHSVSQKKTVNTDFALVEVPLECLLCDDTFKLFDKEGNLKFNGERFEINNSADYIVYIGESKIVLPSGNIINIGENKFSSLIYDYNKKEYTEDYIVVKGTETNNLIDKSNNVITELGDSHYYSMFSDVGIILYRDGNTDKYYAFDYVNRKKLFESDNKIEYLDGYKCFKVWNNGVNVYSLKGNLIYSDKGE